MNRKSAFDLTEQRWGFRFQVVCWNVFETSSISPEESVIRALLECLCSPAHQDFSVLCHVQIYRRYSIQSALLKLSARVRVVLRCINPPQALDDYIKRN